MAKLSEEAKIMIREKRVALVATAGKSGKPNVSTKGLKVLDDEHVAFADIASPRTMANLVENPQVAIIVYDAGTRKGCRLWGKAEVLDSGNDFETMAADLAKMNMKVKHLVKVTLDQVETF
jgi:predicted pyridoxine 5'-phosphate oxidase superfamily flavin-nucleotide-binding protein